MKKFLSAFIPEVEKNVAALNGHIVNWEVMVVECTYKQLGWARDTSRTKLPVITLKDRR